MQGGSASTTPFLKRETANENLNDILASTSSTLDLSEDPLCAQLASLRPDLRQDLAYNPVEEDLSPCLGQGPLRLPVAQGFPPHEVGD